MYLPWRRWLAPCASRSRADSGVQRLLQPPADMFGFGRYGGYGLFDEDDHLHRGDWSEKSGAASSREASARSAFTELRGEFAANGPEKEATVELLKPSTHLTAPCWRDFKKFVTQHEGWSTKRRQATDAEKRQHGETRKGAVYFVDVTFKPSAKAAKAPKSTSKATKTASVDQAAREAARSQMSSTMSSWVASGKRPAQESAAASEAKKPCVAASGFAVRYSRTSEVVEWDQQTFCDCRPSEADDAMEETNAAASAYDETDVATDGVTYDSAAVANQAARDFVSRALATERKGRGSLDPPRAGVDAEWSRGYTPPRTSDAPAEALSAEGLGVYTARATLFCDPYGADVHNVVVATLEARVVRA